MPTRFVSECFCIVCENSLVFTLKQEEIPTLEKLEKKTSGGMKSRVKGTMVLFLFFEVPVGENCLMSFGSCVGHSWTCHLLIKQLFTQSLMVV